MKSSSKVSLIAAAVAAAIGANANAAVTVSPDFTFYAAGGSAQENAVLASVFSLLNNVVEFTDLGPAASCSPSGTWLILYGQAKAQIGSSGTTIAAGKNILFFYRFGGGSFPNGIQPQVAATTVLFPTVAEVQAGGSTVCTNNPVSYLPGSVYLISAATTTGQVPDWGVSDEEVPLFNFPYNLNGSAQLTAAQLANIGQTGIYDNLYGFAVTNVVFANKTNFTKQEVAGILAGTITDWSQLYADNGSQLAAGPIYFLDRGSGSGSKAAGTQYFLGYPGDLGTGGALTPNSVSNAAGVGPGPAGNVNAGYSGTTLNLSGASFQDVKEGSNAAIVNDLNAADTAGKRAVAILGLEFPPAQNQTGGVNHYSFVKLNGVGPDAGTGSDNVNGTTATTYSNIVKGTYDFYYQNSYNQRTSFPSGTAAANFDAAVLAALQNSALAGANASKALPNAVPGLLLDPSVLGLPDVAGEVTGSRLGNSTSPLQLLLDSAVLGGAQPVFGSDPL